MDTKILTTLKATGLDDKQARIYLAALELGGATVTEIARKARVERVNTYYILDQLIQQGFVSVSIRKNGSLYSAINPRNLVKRVEANLEQLQGVLPQLVALEKSNLHRPTVAFFEGREGMKHILDDMIQTLEKLPVEEREILEYLSIEGASRSIYDEQLAFMRQRIKKKIKLRWILPDSEGAEHFVKTAQESYREIRLVPRERFPLHTEMNIYGNKINLLAEKGAEGGIIIEHPELAQTQREIFELAWLGAEVLEKKKA